MGFCLEVSGEFACFTRPEMKVERVSYDVITPSAARNIFQAILWKPAIDWRIHKIEVLKPIRWISLRRNEVSDVIASSTVNTAMKNGSGHLAQYIEDQRLQRAGLLLRDVSYRIHADFVMTGRAGIHDNSGKFTEMFRRRVNKGQCFNQPYLGTREFSCSFRLVHDPDSETPAIDDTRDLGWMLFDMDFSNKTEPTPQFFHAHMNKGVIQIPAINSQEVRG